MKLMSSKVKLFLFLVLVALTLVVPAIQTTQSYSAAAARQEGTCSGDDCGCGVAGQACIAACNGNTACIRQCRCDWLNCSRVCCGSPPNSCR